MISERYGWEDDVVRKLPYKRFFEIVEIIEESKRREVKENLISSAFVAWQIISAFSAKRISFANYLKKLGLYEKPKVPKQYLAILKKEALALAEKIKSLDRKRKI